MPTEEGGNVVTISGSGNDSDDDEFAEITYSAPGTYTYTITEAATEGSANTGIVNGTTTQTVTVIVANEDGVLTATVKGADGTDEEPSENTTFTNTYKVTPVKVDPPVQKIIENNPDLYNKGDFTFTITVHAILMLLDETAL
jgi:pilin isopeptide linkage protein